MLPERIHFIGIGGIGVSALAQVAQARGCRVSGSDPNADAATNPAVARLLGGGATVCREHRAENLPDGTELVVATAAVKEDNPEIVEARRRGIRVVSRADFLGELMAAHKGPKIAVAGTHGKTTTTAMIGVMLQHAGLDPTVFVGGEVAQLGGNVRVGSEIGPFVAEACEAYNSFLSLKPDIAVITNIEADHLDHYGTFEKVKESFLRFVRNVPVDTGCLILCMDDPVLCEMSQELVRREDDEKVDAISYSVGMFLHPASIGENYGRPTRFGITCVKDKWIGAPPVHYLKVGVTSERGIRVALYVPGRHNVSNALAAVGVGLRLGMELETIAAGLGEFRSVERRQEVLGEERGILVMDDYAHHPTEIRATLDALRSAYPERRLVAVFQPHLYSRTRDFLQQFGEELSKADALIVTDIYAAREKPIEGVSAADIVEIARKHNPKLSALYVGNKNEIPQTLRAQAHPNDLVVVLGAGDIRAQGEAFVQLLKEQGNLE